MGFYRYLSVFLLVVCMVSLAPAQLGKPPIIQYIKPNKTSLNLYEKFEASVTLTAQYSNPFDAGDISVDARITGPDNKPISIPAFYYQEYQRTLKGNQEELIKVMEPLWKVRFTPTMPGKYTYTIAVQDKNGIARSPSQEFTVNPARDKGFIRRTVVNPYYFQFDDRTPYFAIGQNVCWSNSKGTYDYDEYFRKMSAHGENYTRLWMGHWNLGLEYAEKAGAGFNGLGKYHLGNAYKLDYILEQAEKSGLYIMLCLDPYSNLHESGNPSDKQRHFDLFPYNEVLGGPCAAPQDFFTNEKAKKWYKNRLRYIVARWGYSTHLFAWEFFNEVDLTDNFNPATVAAWHHEMGQYIRQQDPYQHLITTSCSDPAGPPVLWNVPEIDMVQTHSYSNAETAEIIKKWCLEKRAKYTKPHLYGEMGLDVNGVLERTDTTGIYLQQAVWASAMSGSAGTAMSWWWDSVIEPFSLYTVFSGLAQYSSDIPWVRGNLVPLKYSAVRFVGNTKLDDYKTAILRPGSGWGEKEYVSLYHLGAAGNLVESMPINEYLHGSSKRDLQHPMTFSVDYPVDGEFIVRVVQASNQALVSIKLDNVEKLSHEFIPGPGEGEWKEVIFNKEHNMYQNRYDMELKIPVSKGKHVIELRNDGTDWIQIGNLRFTNYISSLEPWLRIQGLQNNTQVYFWMQNKEYNLETELQDRSINPVKNAWFDISGLKTGQYSIEWYSTEDGKLLKTWTQNTKNESLSIAIPDIRTTLAAKLKWISE